jgi:hypothetical protein
LFILKSMLSAPVSINPTELPNDAVEIFR